MRKLIYYIIPLTILSCTDPEPQDRSITSIDPSQSITSPDEIRPGFTTVALYDTSNIEEELEEETATFYIVVADTSTSYYGLRDQMFHLHDSLEIPIDTMGRMFNASKNLIALPDNDEDDLYAGDYMPRRFPSTDLSLEYLGFYQQNAAEKTIALVTGIYESKADADSALAIIKQVRDQAFLITANIYTGCIH